MFIGSQLKVQHYLRSKVGSGISVKEALKSLHKEHYIKSKVYADRVVLNYVAGASKQDSISSSCRGLILSLPEFNVISRTFDRFFNLGEVEGQDTNMTNKWVLEKLDGSLIPVYFDEITQCWQIATRGTAFGEANPPNNTLTYRDLVLSTLDMTEKQFQDWANYYFDEDVVYICEITSPDNRIVTPYTEDALTLLAVRNKRTGEYEDYSTYYNKIFAKPNQYIFNSVESVKIAVERLDGFKEGYVVYNKSGTPLYKIKSSEYVRIHHLRGDLNPSPKRLASLVINGEADEYLTYFEEDKDILQPYVYSLNRMLNVWQEWYNQAVTDTTTQKEFAKLICKEKYSAVFFKARAKDISIPEAFYLQKENYMVDKLLEFMYPF